MPTNAIRCHFIARHCSGGHRFAMRRREVMRRSHVAGRRRVIAVVDGRTATAAITSAVTRTDTIAPGPLSGDSSCHRCGRRPIVGRKAPALRRGCVG